MINYIKKTIINTAKLMPNWIKFFILNIFVHIKMKLLWLDMKKIWDYYYLIDNNKKIKIAFCIKPHVFDIYVIVWYLKKYNPKEWDIIIDWGGFHWIVWMYLAKIVGKKWKVFIFEPDPINFHELEKNISINKFDNIIAIQKWMRNVSENIDFIIDWQWSSIYIEESKKTKKICKVEVVNPILELEKYWINHIDFIKMDIEWAEIKVVEWMEEYLKKNNVNFAIASYHILPWEKEQTNKKLESIFKKIWYQYETSFYEHLTTYAAKKL